MSMFDNEYYKKYCKDRFKLNADKIIDTDDYERDSEGDYVPYSENENIFIRCGSPKNKRIYYYGKNTRLTMDGEVFVAYYRTGVKYKDLEKALGEYHLETVSNDSEKEVYFLDKGIEIACKTMGAVTAGAKIMPYKIKRKKKEVVG